MAGVKADDAYEPYCLASISLASVADGVAGVEGRSNQFDTPTLLRTRIENLTKGEAHACRAQILASFVWSQYCEPLLVD